MSRVLAFLLVVATLALGLAYFAERPGSVVVTWLGYEVETSVFAGVLALVAMVAGLGLLWALLRFAITRPAAIARFLRDRRERRGLDALTRGLVAVGAGDKVEARRYAALARRTLPHAPLTSLLRAQAAELEGSRATARRIYEAMTEQPEMRLLGLRGLFLEASREQEIEAAKQFASRAVEAKPALAWSVQALFDLQCRTGDWEGALATLEVARRNSQIDRAAAARRRAVLLTAQAMAAEASDLDRARELALQAHKLAPDLVPAAEIAGRLLAARGSISHASRVLARSWRLLPHPDLAQAYAFVRPGDSPRDRLRRVRKLAHAVPTGVEGAISLANAAIDAQDWHTAREALQPHLDRRPPARVCIAMARIEQGEHGDRGRAREWLARALRAPRDPAWVADGVVAERWAPVSPVTGELDAFAWTVPPDQGGARDEAALLEDLAAEPTPALTAWAEPDGPGEAVSAVPETPVPEAPVAAATAPKAPAVLPEPIEPEAPSDAPPDAEGHPAPSAEARPPGPLRRDEPPPQPTPQAEPRIFVPPRAPDDPGPDSGDMESDTAPPGGVQHPPRH